MEKEVMILGNGPITGAIIVALRQYSSRPIIICTSKQLTTDDENNIRLIAGQDVSYRACVKKAEESSEDFIRRLNACDGIGIINDADRSSKQVWESSSVFVSVCREGIISTYAPILNDLQLKEQTLLVFLDNDIHLHERAKKTIENPNIVPKSGSIHCVVPKMDIDRENATIVYAIKTDIRLYLPVEASPVADKVQLFIGPSTSHVSFQTEAEIKDVAFYKKCYINAPHTLLSLLAYSKQVESGISDAGMMLKEFFDYDTAYRYCYEGIAACSNYYKKEIDKDWLMSSSVFIHHLTSSDEEVLSRALPLPGEYDRNTCHKLEDHIAFINEALEKTAGHNELSSIIQLALDRYLR